MCGHCNVKQNCVNLNKFLYLCSISDYLLDVLWETDEFRLTIQRQIDSVFPQLEMEGDEPRSSAEAENRIFARAKNAADYLSLAASVITFLKNKTVQANGGDVVQRQRRCSSQDLSPRSVFGNDSISLDQLDHFIRL